MGTPASSELSILDRAILEVIQHGFPLVADPYADIARQVGSTREEAHAAVQSLRRRGIIRRIGGSFAAQALGYVSVLVAARVEPEQLEAVASFAGDYPEVTHNYQRDNIYNLWFTVIAESPQRLEDILESIRRRPGVTALHALPAERTYKIRVNFNF
jgi:DNA-binding Lrp family transcriptional regulator